MLAAPLLAACLAGPGTYVEMPPFYPAPFSWRVGCNGNCVILKVDAGAGRYFAECYDWPSLVARDYADGVLERRARTAWKGSPYRARAAWEGPGPRRTFPAATFRRFVDASLEQWGVRP